MFQNRDAPVVTLGSWLPPPEKRHGRDGTLISTEWQMPTGAYIGPVTEVKKTDKYVSVCVKGWYTPPYGEERYTRRHKKSKEVQQKTQTQIVTTRTLATYALMFQCVMNP